jgi:type IV secretory pathway protease TraF
MIVKTLVLMRFPAFIPIAILSGCLMVWLMHSFTLNISDSSTSRGVYYMQAISHAKTGDLVVMREPMKSVAALAGQHVRFSPQGVYVDGRLLPNSAPEPALARVCPFGDYIVPPNMFLAMGTNNPDSFDGRYECFETQNLIMGKAIPMVTW